MVDVAVTRRHCDNCHDTNRTLFTGDYGDLCARCGKLISAAADYLLFMGFEIIRREVLNDLLSRPETQASESTEIAEKGKPRKGTQETT